MSKFIYRYKPVYAERVLRLGHSVQPIHVTRIKMLPAGKSYHGGPRYLQYPEGRALCGVKTAREYEDGEAAGKVTCARCRALLRKEEA